MRLNTTFWIQLLGIIFGLAMLYFTFVRYKRKELRQLEWLGWSMGWIALVIVAVTPPLLDPIIAPLRFYRRLDFFVVFGFFILLGLGFYNYSVLKNLERKLETFVRSQAISGGLSGEGNPEKKETEKEAENGRETSLL